MPSDSLIEKLSPSRFPDLSGKMVAVVSCVLRQDWAVPQIRSLWVTPDGSMQAMNDGEDSFCHFIGNAIDVDRNWAALLSDAALTEEEHQEAVQLYKSVVTDFRFDHLAQDHYRTVLEYQRSGDVADSVQQFAADILKIAIEVVACDGDIPQVNRHPVCRVWIEHLAQLAGLGGCQNRDAVREALEVCQGRAEAVPQDCPEYEDFCREVDEQ